MAAAARRMRASEDGGDEADAEASAVHVRAGLSVDDGASIDELLGDGILHASTIAKIFTSVGRGRWTTRRAKRFLKRSGIGFQMGGPQDEWATTTIELREHYPALWRLVEAKLVDLL